MCSSVRVTMYGSKTEDILNDNSNYWENKVHLSNRCSLKTGDKFCVSLFALKSFCLSALADFSDSFHVSFFLSTSVWPFYFYFPPIFPAFLTFRLCAWLSVFTFSHPPALSHSASFHLFLYLSRWELMWPLCAVSSLRGRQSSSAPIRTALSGAVSTTGLPTHSSIHVRHPPATGWELERCRKKEQVTLWK